MKIRRGRCTYVKWKPEEGQALDHLQPLLDPLGYELLVFTDPRAPMSTYAMALGSWRVYPIGSRGDDDAVDVRNPVFRRGTASSLFLGRLEQLMFDALFALAQSRTTGTMAILDLLNREFVDSFGADAKQFDATSLKGLEVML